MASPLDVFRPDALTGHVAIVTGGGTGICRGIAAAYARLGAEVCIVSRKQEVLDATAKELGAAAINIATRAEVRDGVPSFRQVLNLIYWLIGLTGFAGLVGAALAFARPDLIP